MLAFVCNIANFVQFRENSTVHCWVEILLWIEVLFFKSTTLLDRAVFKSNHLGWNINTKGSFFFKTKIYVYQILDYFSDVFAFFLFDQNVSYKGYSRVMVIFAKSHTDA